MVLYELALMGAPKDEQIDELQQYLSDAIEPFGLHLAREVIWSIKPADFDPSQKTSAAIVFFGAVDVSIIGLDKALRKGIPVLPVASATGCVHDEIPDQLKTLNCLTYKADGPQRIATALLECAGLLPRQRRVFLSYRRDEARGAALQIFDALSARLFDVFLDTHGIAPGEDFQAVLWHRLCDSDVLVMLDTPGYFESRWTSAEFGRALSKGISVLRVGWPAFSPSPRTSVASLVQVTESEIDRPTGRLSEELVNRICIQLEAVRSASIAVRSLNFFSNLKQHVERIEGSIIGVGLHKAIYVSLPDGTNVVVYPVVGVPTSLTLNEAVNLASGPDHPVAVVYDHLGLHPNWMKHLAWLGDQIHAARWVKLREADWSFAGWGVGE